MAVRRELTKASVSMKLNNGTIDGKVQTVGVSMGKLNPDGYGDDTAAAIKNALAPMFSKSLYETIETLETDLYAN